MMVYTPGMGLEPTTSSYVHRMVTHNNNIINAGMLAPNFRYYYLSLELELEVRSIDLKGCHSLKPGTKY